MQEKQCIFDFKYQKRESAHYLPSQPFSLRLSLQSVPLLKGSCEGDSMISHANENSNIEKFAFHYWHGHKVNVYYFFCVDQDNSDIYHFSKGNLSLYCFSILSIEVCIVNCRWRFFFSPSSQLWFVMYISPYSKFLVVSKANIRHFWTTLLLSVLSTSNTFLDWHCHYVIMICVFEACIVFSIWCVLLLWFTICLVAFYFFPCFNVMWGLSISFFSNFLSTKLQNGIFSI